MFCSYNFPIIDGKVPSYTMMSEENGERKNKKIIWE